MEEVRRSEEATRRSEEVTRRGEEVSSIIIKRSFSKKRTIQDFEEDHKEEDEEREVTHLF